MRYLYIDTSSSYLYSAIIEDDKILSNIEKEFGQDLSKDSLPMIASMFQINNLKPTDIDKIIVVNGPGSFTGIRIGVTIAKTYAWALKIPIVPILSLEAMALSSKNETVHVPIINARRGYVFGAIYDENYKELLKPQHIKLEELLVKLKEYPNYSFISNDSFETLDNIEKYTPDFIKIVKFAKERQSVNPHALNPEYLKLTEAEESIL